MKRMKYFGIALALLIFVPGFSSAQGTLPDSAAQFAFEECSGGVYTGDGAFGGVGCQLGRHGQAADFDGVDDGIEIADSPAYHFTTEMTIAAWVKPDAISNRHPVANKWYAMDSYWLGVRYGKYRFHVAFPDGGWGTVVGVEAPATVGVWAHVAGVYDGSSIALYVNGEMVASTPASGVLQPSNRPLNIGNNPSWDHFDGLIDELRLYGKALTPLQVHELASVVPNPHTGSPSSDQDLDVTLLNRSPRIDYDAKPNVPAPGSIVTWTAHLRNRGSADVVTDYAWYIDGDLVAHVAPFFVPAGQTVTVDLQWPWSWDNEDHYLSFFIDTYNQNLEKSEKNNLRMVRTNALMVGLWVEESVYDYFDAYQYRYQLTHDLGNEANSWEDWAQRQIDRWNVMLANSVTGSTPEGGLDRVRLDQVIVVPDGALPLNGGEPTNHPDIRDKTVDMMWGFPAPVDTTFYDFDDPNGNFNLQPALIHELHHARYLVDTYWLNIHGNDIEVEDDQGKRIFPDNHDMVHRTSAGSCIMDDLPWCYSEWSVAWMNVYARQRPLPGWANYNAHAGVTQYMLLTPTYPSDNVLRVYGINAQPLSGAEVVIYQGDERPGSDDPFSRVIDNKPDIVATTDERGELSIGARPCSQDPIDGDNYHRCVYFMKIRYQGQEVFSWFDLPRVHVQYFRGVTGTATHQVRTLLDPSISY